MRAPIVALFALACSYSTAIAAELKGFVGVGFRPVLEALRPIIAKDAGISLDVSYQTSESTAEALKNGEVFDFLLMSPLTLGILSKSSPSPWRTWDVAKNGVGVGVRKGAVKPDVSSMEALKGSLSGAASVAYNDAGPAGAHFLDLLRRLGLMEQMKPKLRPMRAGQPVPAVARGEAEIVIVVTPAILEDAGVELAGELPEEAQSYSFQTLALSPTSRQPLLVDQLRIFLTSAGALAVMRRFGMGAP